MYPILHRPYPETTVTVKETTQAETTSQNPGAAEGGVIMMMTTIRKSKMTISIAAVVGMMVAREIGQGMSVVFVAKRMGCRHEDDIGNDGACLSRAGGKGANTW